MTRHHLMLTYWRDTSQPIDPRAMTISEDDPARLADMAVEVLARFVGRGDQPKPQDGLWDAGEGDDAD